MVVGRSMLLQAGGLSAGLTLTSRPHPVFIYSIIDVKGIWSCVINRPMFLSEIGAIFSFYKINWTRRKKPWSMLPSYLSKLYGQYSLTTKRDQKRRSWLISWQSITLTIYNTLARRFNNQSFANTSLSTKLPAGLTVSIVSEEKRHCITAVKFHIRSPAEHHLRGFLSLAVKLIWTCVRLPFMEQEAVGSVFPQHTSALRNACEATLEMKTHGENNKLIRRMKRAVFSQLKVPEWPSCYEPEKEAQMKTPRLPLARDTLTLTLSLCCVQVWVSTCYK